VASVVPASVSFDDYDFDLKLTREVLGVEGGDLKFEGKGQKNEVEFTFEVPITQIKGEYTMESRLNQQLGYDAFVYSENQWVFEIDAAALKVSGAELSDEEKNKLIADLKVKVDDLKGQVQSGKEEIIPFFPMDVAIPFVGMFYASQFAETIEFPENFLDYGFSMKHLNMLTKKQQQLLKNIEGDFYKSTNEKGEQALMQVLLDDNFFNSVFSVALSIDKMFSMRDMAKGNQKVEPFLQMLTTTNIGTIFPQFSEEYGAGKKIDVVMTPSHEFFLDGFPKAKMSGIYMDRNGNWKIMINLALQLNVETLPGMWDPIRNIFLTLQFKMKMQQNEQDGLKSISIMPKNLELTQIKVIKGENEVMDMEQMMLQSMANIQLEQAKKLFKPYTFNVNQLVSKNPTELQCFGFMLSDLDLSFKKSQAQFSVYYKDVDTPDSEVCGAFKEQLAQQPQKIFNHIKTASEKAAQTMKDMGIEEKKPKSQQITHDEL
jgi:hypothetical protein